MDEDEKLVNEYIGAIVAQPSNAKKLFILGFIGLNGVGKTFISEKIAEKLGLYIASNDRIRRFLNTKGFEGASPAQHLVQEIAERSTNYLFENNISHIIDADLIEFHKTARINANKYGAKLFLIKLVCPEEIILDRLNRRSKETEINPALNLSRVGAERYFERKRLHESLELPEIFFSIDTSQGIDSQIEDLVNSLIKENVV